MKKFAIYTVIVLIITIILPTIIVKTFKFVPIGDKFNIDSLKLKGGHERSNKGKQEKELVI